MKKLIPFLVLFCVFHFYEINAQQATCDAVVINVTIDVQNGEVDNQHAETTLTATNTIESGGEATYKAGTEITLSPGFHAKEGAEFTGLIEDCSLTGALFITEWVTDGPNETVTIPTFLGETYDYQIDWDYDGVTFSPDDTGVGGDISNSYDNAGTHVIAILGDFPRIYFWKTAGFRNTANSRFQIRKVTQWGNIDWSSMEGAFSFCTNLNVTAGDIPDLDEVSSMSGMFWGCTSLNGHSFSEWKVNNVTDMSNLFRESSYNSSLVWNDDTQNVTNMSGMFQGAQNFNQNISNWNVEKVQNMSFMFSDALDFDQPLNWLNTTSVQNMRSMFEGAESFDKDIGNWDVSNVKDMSGMFKNTLKFNTELDWGDDTKEVEDMSEMFRGAEKFDKNISNWNVEKVKNMSYMFADTPDFNQPLNWLDTSLVENMSHMFSGAEKFDQNISSWDVIGVTNMSAMFANTLEFDQPLDWGDRTQNVQYMTSMFLGAQKFNRNIGGWYLDDVISMSGMFQNSKLFDQDLNWGTKTGGIQNMNYMFYQAEAFDQDIGDWNINGVTSMEYMLDFSNLSTGNYENTLNGWAQNPTTIPQGVVLRVSGLTYCDQTGRDILRDNSGPDWLFIGDFISCPSSAPPSFDSFILEAESFTIYPNPAEDRIFIEGLSKIEPDYQIQILDIAGRLVLSTEDQTEIDVSKLRSGVYFIKIIGEDEVTKKFIKM